MCHLILFTPVFALPVFWFFPLNTALPIYISILAISGFLYFKVFQAMRLEVRTGQEAMLGKEGLVVEDIAPEGKVQYASETWDAMAEGKRFLKGEKVKISGFQRMRLLVEERPVEQDTLGKRTGNTQATSPDPVCGMKVSTASSNLVATHKGTRYYFCAAGCQTAFRKNPDKYLKPRGPFSRLLARLAKSNEKAFGRAGPSCH